MFCCWYGAGHRVPKTTTFFMLVISLNILVVFVKRDYKRSFYLFHCLLLCQFEIWNLWGLGMVWNLYYGTVIYNGSDWNLMEWILGWNKHGLSINHGITQTMPGANPAWEPFPACRTRPFFYYSLAWSSKLLLFACIYTYLLLPFNLSQVEWFVWHVHILPGFASTLLWIVSWVLRTQMINRYVMVFPLVLPFSFRTCRESWAYWMLQIGPSVPGE